MSFIIQGKTNVQYLLILSLLVVIAGGGIWIYQDSWTPSFLSPVNLPVTLPRESQASHIKILSPNGGEEWIEGKTYQITWESQGVEQVSIEVVVGGKARGHIAFNLDAGSGKHSWQIEKGFISGFGPSRSDVVRVIVCDSDNPDVCDENDDYFSIVVE